MLYKTNVSKKIKPFIKDLIKECRDQRATFKPTGTARNYFLNTKYAKNIYDIFIEFCCKKLNKFQIKDKNLKVWCYFSDKNYIKGNWHDHIGSSTIVGVLYLKIPKKNKGIDFLIKNKVVNYRPKEGELFIFPNYFAHYPHPSETTERISLNLELNCIEDSIDIFKK